MDKKIKEKSSNFFKKEGFYVVLFVCLCIVATVAAVSAKNNKMLKTKPPVAENKIEDKKEVADGSEEIKMDMQNALQVKDDSKEAKNNAQKDQSITVPKDGKDSAAVTKAADTKFAKPIEGSLARGYSEDTVYCETLGTWRTKSGIDIKADLGTKVVAALDGVVEKVDNDSTELGKYIIVNHQNGLKTIYANLDENVVVKQGQKITKGQQLGKTGKTAGNYSNEKYGDHLHFEVMKDNANVDPAKFISYK